MADGIEIKKERRRKDLDDGRMLNELDPKGKHG